MNDPLHAEPPALDQPPQRPHPFGRYGPLVCDGIALPAPMNLAQAMDLALCSHAQIRMAWNDIKMQASTLGQAQAAYLPTLSASITRLDDDTRYPDSSFSDTNERSTRRNLNINWRVFDFGARAANVEAARQQIDAALHSHNGAVMQVAVETVQAWLEVQVAQASVQSRLHMIDLAGKTLESALRRQARGVGSETDTLQAKSTLAKTELEYSRALGSYQEGMAMLRYTLGLPEDADIALSGDMDDYLAGRNDTSLRQVQSRLIQRALDGWLEIARKNNPNIASSRARWGAALQQVRATQAEGLPTVDFSFGFYDNGRPTDGATSYRSRERLMGLSVTIPLFDGFGHTYRVRQAQAQADRSKVEHEDITRQTLRDIVRLHAQAKSAWNALDAAESLHQSADKASLSLLRQFEYGTADILRLTQAQQDLSLAEIERISAWAQWEVARLRLMVETSAFR